MNEYKYMLYGIIGLQMALFITGILIYWRG